jgi:hypothetical protein
MFVIAMGFLAKYGKLKKIPIMQCKVEGRGKAIGETSCKIRQSIDTTMPRGCNR